MAKPVNVTLKKVNDGSEFKFLYHLLKERDPRVNISHKKMPTYTEHIKFVKSKPYSAWYIIHINGEKVGSIYLSKQDEIGIFLNKNMKRKGVGSKALKLLIKKHSRKRYLANVSPYNHTSIEFFKKHNFKLIQYTYELTSRSN